MWIGDAEADGLLDEVTKMHCFVVKKYKQDKWKIFVDKALLPQDFIDQVEEKYNVEWFGHEDVNAGIRGLGALAIHNIFGYDLDLFVKLGYIESYSLGPDNIDGTPIRLIDSLSMSRCLWPDRFLPYGCSTKVYDPVNKKYRTVGPHGLAAWGYRVSNKKPVVDDWVNQPLEVYVDRCIEDVIINDLTMEKLIAESEDTAIGGTEPNLGLPSGWRTALKINNKNDYMMEVQNKTGILIDVPAMELLLARIDRMMTEIAGEIEPSLPRRELSESAKPKFPAKPFNDDGCISANGYNWLTRLGYEVDQETKTDKPITYPAKPFKKNMDISASGLSWLEKVETDMELPEDDLKAILRAGKDVVNDPVVIAPELLEKAKNDLRNRVMPDMTVPMTMSNQDDIKKYLFEVCGWQPTIWRTKDVSRDDRKQTRSDEDIAERLEVYVNKTLASTYRYYVYEEMELDFERGHPTMETLVDKLKRKARFLVTSPQLKDERGELCPSLAMLRGDMAKKIVKWLSLRNRRSTIKPLDDKKETGWLNNKRLLVDGRIGQGHSGPTNTNRYKHRTIVNLPKADPRVLLGKEFRSLFVAPKGKKVLGYDGSNLEQFVAASYAFHYDGGDYAAKLSGDAHATNAIAYTIAAGREVDRTEGKNITYAVLYGAQKAKIAKMLGIKANKAQEVINAFWDTNYGLKALRDDLEEYWTATGKKYIMGIDGRKIFTRSKHSLVNALFQSCGSIIMFLSACYMYDMLTRRGLLEEGVARLAFVHDEFQYEVPDELIETVASFPIEHINDDDCAKATKKLAAAYEDPHGRLLSNPQRVGNNYEVYYCQVGELGNLSLKKAGEYLKMPLPFSASYDIGLNLADTH